MCLIIQGPAAKVRDTLLTTPGLLRDIFESNKDGIGAMFTTDDGALNVTKALPKNIAEAEAFIEQLPESGRDLALHFRMRTHGDVDLTNCHPYPVVDGQVHLMHNGVINHVDDSSDRSKSDTWHYIDQVIRPQIEAAPNILHVPAWQQLIADDIGSNNKFVLLDQDGHMIVLNKRTGLEHDGMWFSNTYAWTPNLLIPNYRFSSRAWMYDDDDRWAGYGSYGGGQGTSFASKGADFKPVIKEDEVWGAVAYGDADSVDKLLKNYPVSTLHVLYEKDEFVCSVAPKDLAAQDAHIVKLLEDGNEERILKYCRKSETRRRKVAEVIAWYGDWVSKSGGAKRADQVIEGDTTETKDEATHEVVDGNVVPIKGGYEEENPDEADLGTWRTRFQEWMARQGYSGDEDKTPALLKPPAKWSATESQNVFPTSEQPPAQVAPVGSRKVYYRGYGVEVPQEIMEGDGEAFHDYLEREAQRLHNEAVARLTVEPSLHDADEATNDAYAG